MLCHSVIFTFKAQYALSFSVIKAQYSLSFSVIKAQYSLSFSTFKAQYAQLGFRKHQVGKHFIILTESMTFLSRTD
jgi:hypothetical protein